MNVTPALMIRLIKLSTPERHNMSQFLGHPPHFLWNGSVQLCGTYSIDDLIDIAIELEAKTP
jgi:hypothetical protein